MPGDVLDELLTVAPVAVSLENIDDLIRVCVRELSQVMNGMTGSAAVFDNIWRRIVLEVGRGRTAEMQALRPRLMEALTQRLGLLGRARERASWLSVLGRPDAPSPDVLSREIAELTLLKAEIFDRWQAAGDLERLAAEHYPLSQAQLERVAAAHAPPPEWYAGEEEQLIQE